MRIATLHDPRHGILQPARVATSENTKVFEKRILALILQRLNPQGCKATIRERNLMLNWTLTFLIIALIAGLLGFTGVAGTAMGIAQILFVVFLVLFLASLLVRRRA